MCWPKARDVALPEVDAISAARRWSDGWRGGLLGTCDFDLGFYGPWFTELAKKVGSDAVLLIDPSAALVDPVVLDSLVAHADAHPDIEFCFVPAAPGLGGAFCAAQLARPPRRRQNAWRTVAALPPRPDQPRGPWPERCASPFPPSVARTTQRFKLDSDRQIARLSGAMVSLNGHLISSSAEELVHRAHAWEPPDPLPREVVLELNTNRNTRPIWWAGSHHAVSRRRCAWTWPAPYFTTLRHSMTRD